MYFVIRNKFTTFKYHDDVYLQIFSTYVRPILEYATQVWSPVLKLNMDCIVNVQRYYIRCTLQQLLLRMRDGKHNDSTAVKFLCSYPVIDILEAFKPRHNNYYEEL